MLADLQGVIKFCYVLIGSINANLSAVFITIYTCYLLLMMLYGTFRVLLWFNNTFGAILYFGLLHIHYMGAGRGGGSLSHVS